MQLFATLHYIQYPCGVEPGSIPIVSVRLLEVPVEAWGSRIKHPIVILTKAIVRRVTLVLDTYNLLRMGISNTS
jgi:hypothetical protein